MYSTNWNQGPGWNVGWNSWMLIWMDWAVRKGAVDVSASQPAVPIQPLM